ncbi:four helix bundle protein [Chryseobacterium indologenes]|uniref:four helix bundle protein n=1 Tax=Chryseobacterium indologenes TaxID=253 RepID=UPI00405921AD
MSMELSRLTLDLTDTFPTYEKYGLKNQMDRCAISIPSNIAEGSSRTNKSFSHFLDISLGSSFELQTQIVLANHRNIYLMKKLKSLKLRLKNFKSNNGISEYFKQGLRKQKTRR